MSNATLSKSIDIKIAANTYTVKYPNVGKTLDIDLLKLQMANGQYDVMKFSYNPAFQKQVTRIDAIATFNILIPELKKDLNAKSMFDLDYEQMEVITKAYVEDFLPWFEAWEALLNTPTSEEKIETKGDTIA